MKRIALCIGNDNYSNLPKLNCARNDAHGMADILERLGFDTQKVFDVDRSQMISFISDFTDKLKEYDSCVFYYAGHGFQIDGDNILAPIDLNTNRKNKEVKMYAFPLEELMNQLVIYPNKTKVIIIDACRDTLNNRGTFEGFAPILAPKDQLLHFQLHLDNHHQKIHLPNMVIIQELY